jgi:hypothetical protein
MNVEEKCPPQYRNVAREVTTMKECCRISVRNEEIMNKSFYTMKKCS